MPRFHLPFRVYWSTLCTVVTVGGMSLTAKATDYFLTLAGGYNRGGNQASLEANVLFYQRLLADQVKAPVHHSVFFADGTSPDEDLQVLADQSISAKLPATELLSQLHRRRGITQVTYRDHHVPDVAGRLDPELVREKLATLSNTLKTGDRLIIYVTAHGSPGSREDAYNTAIDCWNETKFTAKEFTSWLDQLPAESQVIMVMAQCYCGGFSHTIFDELEPDQGLSQQVRAGFFAQQHDLAAAGCRPDIEHDQEFSSYFWGAFAGRSRNGVEIKDVDLDQDGQVSFAEAYAYAVVASETIDVPLKTSDVMLKTFSRLEHPDDKTQDPESSNETEQAAPSELFLLAGPLQKFVDHGGTISGRTVSKLAQSLGFSLDTDVSDITREYEENRRSRGMRGRGGRGFGGGLNTGGPGGRRSSGRRDLLTQITEKWPELGDPQKWMKSELLKLDNQTQLLEQIQSLPAWSVYKERSEQIEQETIAANERELRAVKCRRLLQTLESIALAQNLPHFATPDVQARYRQLIELEHSGLTLSSH